MNEDIDSHKLMYHPERVAQWRVNGDCFPIYVEIGPTNRCNHRCKFCALDYLDSGGVDINPETLTRTLEDMAEHGVKSVMYAGEGEPLLHKEIASLVQTAKKNEMDVAINTNGVMFTQEKAEGILPFLSWIRFSLDAGTENTYSFVHKTRPGDFGKVIENIRYAAELKRKKGYGVTIGVQALLIRQNAEEMETFARLAKEMGVDNIQIKPYSHHPFSNNVDDELVPYAYQTNGLKVKLQAFSDEKFNVVYREKTMERLCEGRTYDQCFGLPFFALVDSRGNVIPCNLFYNMPDFYYGNIHEERFSEIWGGSKRKEVLKRLNETGVANCRNGCRLDASNRYLHRLRNPHPHDTFV